MREETRPLLNGVRHRAIWRAPHQMESLQDVSWVEVAVSRLVKLVAGSRVHVDAHSAIDSAVADADATTAFNQTTFCEGVAGAIGQCPPPEQIARLEPERLGTVFFVKIGGCDDLPSIEAESAPFDCRITAPCTVTAFFENACSLIGVSPGREVEANYITKGVPEGLATLEGHVSATPACAALAGMASATLPRDYRRADQTVDRLVERLIRSLIRENLGQYVLRPDTEGAA